jgi:ATP:ADP antiporter, AAA family
MWDALLIWIRDRVLRFFDIRLGEHRRVLQMQLHIFLIIQCLWIIKPVANAQFLSKAGIEKLPLVFVLVAISALIVTTVYSHLQNRWPLTIIIARTYQFSIAALLSIGLLLNFQLFEDWMSYFFYIGVALFGLITTSQFWLMSNLVFSSLEAKRLFGFVGAGAIAGGISGGYLTSLLAPVLSSENLLFVASGMLIVTLFNNKFIWKNFISEPDSELALKPDNTITDLPFRLVRNSKLLTHLALIMGISVVVAKLVEFQFSSIASERFKGPDQLTAFFGFWFSTANVLSLAVQLLITQKVVRMLGVGRSLLVLPGALIAGAAAVLYTPVLWAGTTLKVLDISLKQSINKAATELLIMPVSVGIKNKVKTFIDVFVDTTATGIGGIILIFVINGLNLSIQAVCVIISILIICWIYLAMRARDEYSKTFMEKLHLPKHQYKKPKATLSDTDIFEGIQKALNSGSTRQILYLLARIEEIRDSSLMKDVIPLLRHESPSVRQAALRCLYYYNDHSITPQIKPLLKDEHDEVRSRAFSCMLAHTRKERIKFIEDYLKDQDPIIRGAALVGLATEARDNPEMQKYFNLTGRIYDIIQLAKQSRNAEFIESSKILVARAIGYGRLESNYDTLMDLLKDSNPVIIKQAILAAGSTEDPVMIKIILKYLGIKSMRYTAHKALNRFKDTDILPILGDFGIKKNIPWEIIKRLPAFAERVHSQQSVDYLFIFLQDPDQNVKRNALQSLLNVRTRFPDLKISPKKIRTLIPQDTVELIDNTQLIASAQFYAEKTSDNSTINAARSKYLKRLKNNSDLVLKNIFYELALLYSPEIILPLFEGIQHKDLSTRTNSLELLDNILESGIKKIVLPVFESLTLILQQQSSEKENVPLSEYKSFEKVLNGQNDKLKVNVLMIIDAQKNEVYAPLIQLAGMDKNHTIKRLAHSILLSNLHMIPKKA